MVRSEELHRHVHGDGLCKVARPASHPPGVSHPSADTASCLLVHRPGSAPGGGRARRGGRTAQGAQRVARGLARRAREDERGRTEVKVRGRGLPWQFLPVAPDSDCEPSVSMYFQLLFQGFQISSASHQKATQRQQQLNETHRNRARSHHTLSRVSDALCHVSLLVQDQLHYWGRAKTKPVKAKTSSSSPGLHVAVPGS